MVNRNTKKIGDEIVVIGKGDGVQDAGEEISKDGHTRRVSRHSGGAVMDGGEEIQGIESAKEVIMREASGGGNKEYIAGAFSLTVVELGQDRDEEFRNGKRDEEIREFMFPGDLGPGASVSRRVGTDVQIVEEEESINNRHVIHADRSDGGLGVFAVIGEASVLDGREHNVK